MSENTINLESMLRVGTILHGSYRIDRYLSSGGFGNTYVATHVDFDETYAVKEFFMKGVTQRDGNNTTVSVSNREKVDEFKGQLEKFKKEARRLRQLNNLHIVRVHDLFEENGTAYYMMDYIDGESLKDRLKRTGRPMTESEVRLILPQILDALKTVHDAGIWHLDLKPANIMLEKGGMIKLIDFGASKQLDVQKGGATTSTAISYTPGYAPREQMEQSYEKFGPWTDFYALGGTLYNLLNNQRTPMPTDINNDRREAKHLALPLPSNISGKTKALILWLMKTYRNDRPASVEKIREFLENGLAPRPVPVQEQEPTVVENDETVIEEHPEPEPSPEEPLPEEPATEPEGPSAWKYIAAGLIVIALIVAGYNLNSSNPKNDVSAESNIEVSEGENNLVIDEPADSSEAEVIRAQEHEGRTSEKKNGYTFLSFEDGTYYEGYVKNGVPHGKGTMTWKNGDNYVGDFINGNRSGQGVYTWTEKRKDHMYKYEGNFLNGQFSGKGTAYYVGGTKEEGIWKNNELIEEHSDTHSDKANERTAVPVSETNTTVYDVVDQRPLFPGGDAALIQWLSSNVIYPKIAAENGIQGRVICQFVVEKDGSISNITVIKSADPSLDGEACRVINSMPRWKPGTVKGVPVRVKYTLPVHFKLN